MKKVPSKVLLTIPEAYRSKKIQMGKSGDELIWTSPSFGKQIREDDFLCQESRGMVHAVIFNEKTGRVSIHLACTVSELEEFVKINKKRQKQFYKRSKKKKVGFPNFLGHLNPELSFCFPIKEPKKK